MKFIQTCVLLASAASAAPLLGGLLAPAAPLVGTAAGILGKTPVVGDVLAKAGRILPGGIIRRDDPLDGSTLTPADVPEAGNIIPGGDGGAAPDGVLPRDGLVDGLKAGDLLKSTGVADVLQDLRVPNVVVGIQK